MLHITKDSEQIPNLPKAVALLAGVYKLITLSSTISIAQRLNGQTLIIHFTFPVKIYLKPITFAPQKKYLGAGSNEQVGSLAKTP